MARNAILVLCAAQCLQLAICQFGFFPQRNPPRRDPFGVVQNFIQSPRRTLEALFNFGRENNRPGIINDNANNENNENNDTGFSNEPSDNENNIPNTPAGTENESNGTPNIPHGSESENSGISEVPEETNNGIPNTQGFEDKNLGAENTPTTDGTLSPLTPVPASKATNNFGNPFFDTCVTPEGGTGSCINVFQCPPYLKLLQQSQSNPAGVQVLRKAHCGFDGDNPKVCCPLTPIPTDPPVSEATQAPSTESPRPSPKTLLDDDYVTALPEPPVCGISNASFTRVVDGVDAKLGDFPWMALLGYRERRGSGVRWLCGGSLITSKHVLTAAHCIHGHENDLYLVRLGELDLAREDEGATPVDVIIKTKIKHEEYNPKSFTNDIGVLVLERDVQFTNLIRPICIPLDSELRARSFVNYNPIIAGWGDTTYRGRPATHLQALQLPVVSNEQCAQAYVKYTVQVIDGRVLCAGYKDGGKDACQGDSGGPLMQPIWDSKKFVTHFYQIGVVSYGKKCAEAGFPGVYTRVTVFVPWLEKTLLGKR
ncbi:venom serine protease Bi-VSP-like isoform X2 [Battus philenor]|uniref:venom serine protease Bi-VSP-like isoform X2 n=1 Tax=Battus philenor TaxID=42288 RepID=UPI0035CFEA10